MVIHRPDRNQPQDHASGMMIRIGVAICLSVLAYLAFLQWTNHRATESLRLAVSDATVRLERVQQTIRNPGGLSTDELISTLTSDLRALEEELIDLRSLPGVQEREAAFEYVRAVQALLQAKREAVGAHGKWRQWRTSVVYGKLQEAGLADQVRRMDESLQEEQSRALLGVATAAQALLEARAAVATPFGEQVLGKLAAIEGERDRAQDNAKMWAQRKVLFGPPPSVEGDMMKKRQEHERLSREQAQLKSPSSPQDLPTQPASATTLNNSGIVMSCAEAKLLLSTVAALKKQGYPLSRALQTVKQRSEFSEGEKSKLQEIVSAIYQYDLSPEKAYLAASLACR